VASLQHGENKKNLFGLIFKAMELRVSLHDSTAGVDEETSRAFWVMTSLGDTKDGKHGVYCNST